MPAGTAEFVTTRWLRRTVLVAVTLLLLGLTARAVGTQALLAGWRVFSPLTVLAALAAGLIVALTQAVRWKVLAAEQQIHLSFRRACGDCYASAFGNLLLPGGLGGDLVVTRERDARSALGEAVLVARALADRAAGA